VTVCNVCAKPLCRLCAPAAEVEPACPSCRRPLKGHWLRLRRLLAPSLASLWLLIGLSLIAYVAFTARRFNVFHAREITDRKELTRRCRLYMTKAARLNHYAEQLEQGGRPDLARRQYRMAILATKRVLADFPETEFPRDLKGEAEQEAESRLRLALAKFLIKTGRPEEAREELDRMLEKRPEGPIGRLVRFRIAETLEATAPHEAIREYEASQSSSGSGIDFLDRIIDAASLNPTARQFFLESTGMSGRYDPAEAQARIIVCHEKLGERLQAEVAYNKLIDRYPFSQQAEEMKKERGAPDAPNPLPRLPFLKRQPWLKNRPSPGTKRQEEEPPEETITIVPLE